MSSLTKMKKLKEDAEGFLKKDTPDVNLNTPLLNLLLSFSVLFFCLFACFPGQKSTRVQTEQILKASCMTVVFTRLPIQKKRT